MYVATVPDEIRCVPHCTQVVVCDGVLSRLHKRRPYGALSICDIVWECVLGVGECDRFRTDLAAPKPSMVTLGGRRSQRVSVQAE